MRALARRPRVQPGIPTLRLVADRGRCRLAPGRVVVTREAHGLEAFRAQGAGGLPPPARGVLGARSEEHTSELQSLMRISYAVFCLQKKKQTKTHHSQLNATY